MSVMRSALLEHSSNSLAGFPSPVLLDQLEITLGALTLNTPSFLSNRRNVLRGTRLPIDFPQGSLLHIQPVLGVKTLVSLDLVPQLLGSRANDASLQGDEKRVGFRQGVRPRVVHVQEELSYAESQPKPKPTLFSIHEHCS